MFAQYNLEKFPNVYILLGNTIQDYNDFTDFTNNWLNLYSYQKNFTLTFDTKNVGLIHPKYALFMAIFIKKIKQSPVQYLTLSTIYVYSPLIFNLLKIIFTIEKPVACVKLIYSIDNNTTTYVIDP